MLPKNTLPEIQYFLPLDPDCEKQNFCKKIGKNYLQKSEIFFTLVPPSFHYSSYFQSASYL